MSHSHRHRNINRRIPYLHYRPAPDSFQRRIAAARLAKSILLYHHNNEKIKNNSTLSRSSIHQQPPFQFEGDNGDKADNREALIEVGANNDDHKDIIHKYPLRNQLRSCLTNPTSKSKYTTTKPHRHNRKQHPSNPKAPTPAGDDSLHANQKSPSNDFHPIPELTANISFDDTDAALKRPGRFDREFNFQLPNCDARANILRIYTCDWACPPSQHLQLELAVACVGYSDADLKALCFEAGLVAFRENFPQVYLTNEKVLIDVSCVKVEKHHFLKAMSKMKPASHRSMTFSFRPLSPVVSPCLQHQLQTVMDTISSIFPLLNVQSNRSTIHSFSRPRLLLIGDNSVGMNHIVSATLHQLEKFSVHTIFPHLLRSTDFRAKTPEEALECLFREARRSKPLVLYLPNFNIWLDSGHNHLMNHLCYLLDMSPANDPILVLGTSPISLDDISNNPSSLFYRDDKLHLRLPSPEDRSAFFDSIVEQVLKGVEGYVENLEPRSMVPMEKGKRVIIESEKYAICQLKKELLSVCNEIVSDKRFKAFINFKDESGRFENCMGLAALIEGINSGRKCKTLKSFLEDVNLVVTKAKKFYKDDVGIVVQGYLLVLEVKNLVSKIDKCVVEMTEKIAEEMKQRIRDGEMSIPRLKKLLVERTDDYGIDKLERLHPKILNHVHIANAIFADAHNNKDDDEEDLVMTRHNMILKCMFEFGLDEANFNY